MVNGMLPIVKEQFISKILLGEYRDALSIAYYAKEIEFTYSSDTTRTVICIALHYNPYAYDPLSEAAKSFLHVELKDPQAAPCLVWLCQTKPDMIACVVHDELLLSNGGNMQLAEMMRSSLMHYGNYYKATIGIGHSVHAMEELHLSYEQAVAAIKQRGMHSNVEICSSGLEQELPQWDSFLSVQDVHCILNQYKTREYDKLLESLYELLAEGKRKNATAVQIKYLCADVLNTWIRAVESEHNELDVPYYSGLFERMNRCMTWEELKICFEDIHKFLFRPVEASNRSQQFAAIVKHIHEHFDQELSIEYFAEMTNMSIGHFSRTFKEEVGEKYVEYIAKYRLTKAKEYLLQTDLKMDEIATKVGYWGRNSLIRAFRRYEGITPSKYRAMHQ